MEDEKLELISQLKFNDVVKINGDILYRTNEPKDLSTYDNYWEYSFYKDWDKSKNMLPKPSHLVRVYVKFKKINNSYIIDKYIKGILIDLNNQNEEEIISIQKLKTHQLY